MSVTLESGGGGRKSVDVELNIVPFIDMMSCMVAFLLISAVWTNLAQINATPRVAGPPPQNQELDPPVAASVLLTADTIWIGLSTGDRRQIRKVGADHDWVSFETTLAELKGSSTFKDRSDIEIGAEGVDYQAIVTAMDSAIAKGFTQVGYMDPGMLSVKFKK
jgi:biopolymer transport protein ExbD